MSRKAVAVPLLHRNFVENIVLQATPFVGDGADGKLVILDLGEVETSDATLDEILCLQDYAMTLIAPRREHYREIVGRYWLARHAVDATKTEALFDLCGKRPFCRIRAPHSAAVALEDYLTVLRRCSALATQVISVAARCVGFPATGNPERGAYVCYHQLPTYLGKWNSSTSNFERAKLILQHSEVSACAWNTLLGGELDGFMAFDLSDSTTDDMVQQMRGNPTPPVRLAPGTLVALRTPAGTYRIAIVVRCGTYRSFLGLVLTMNSLPVITYPIMVSVFAEKDALDDTQAYTMLDVPSIETWNVNRRELDQSFSIFHSTPDLSYQWTRATVMPPRSRYDPFLAATFYPVCFDCTAFEEHAQVRGWTVQRLKHISAFRHPFFVRDTPIDITPEAEAHVLLERAIESTKQMLDVFYDAYIVIDPRMVEPLDSSADSAQILLGARSHIKRTWLAPEDNVRQQTILRGLVAMRQRVRQGRALVDNGHTSIFKFVPFPVDLNKELVSVRVFDQLLQGDDAMSPAKRPRTTGTANERPRRPGTATTRYHDMCPRVCGDDGDASGDDDDGGGDSGYKPRSLARSSKQQRSASSSKRHSAAAAASSSGSAVAPSTAVASSTAFATAAAPSTAAAAAAVTSLATSKDQRPELPRPDGLPDDYDSEDSEPPAMTLQGSFAVVRAASAAAKAASKAEQEPIDVDDD